VGEDVIVQVIASNDYGDSQPMVGQGAII